MADNTFDEIIMRLRTNVECPRGVLEAALRVQPTASGGAEDALDILLKLEQLSNIEESVFSDEVRVAVADALVDKTNPVDVYFKALPTPQLHEPFQLGAGPAEEYATKRYKFALSVFCVFAVFHGLGRITAECEGDPILACLVDIIKQEAEARHLDLDSLPVVAEDRMPGTIMYSRLLHLVWATGVTRDAADLAPYCEETRDLLGYFSWVVLGRKDSTCDMARPWERQRRPPPLPNNRPPAPVEARLDRDHHRRLPSTRNPPARDAEERRLSRLARLFQVTFDQCLLSSMHNIQFSVLSCGGVVSVRRDSGDREGGWQSVGTTPDVDMARPEVRAALHNSACCVVTSWGGALVELFFRKYCASIHVLEFLVRNAATTVECNSMTLQFNMEPLHEVLVLTTAPGREFVLDASCGQYGWVETLAPAEEYHRHRIAWVTSFEPHTPAPARPETRARDTPIPDGLSERSEWLEACVAEDVEELTEEYFDANGGLDHIFALPDSQFDDYCVAFEASLKAKMRDRDGRRLLKLLFHPLPE